MLVGASTPFQSKADDSAQAPFVAGGEPGRGHQHHDQRAQRPRIVQGEPRRRQAGADALDRGQRAFALRLPQRQRDRVLRGDLVGQFGCRAMADAGAAVEAAKPVLAGRPAETHQRDNRPNRGCGKQRQANGARHRRQRQPNPAQDSARNSPTRVRSRARCGQTRSQAMAYWARSSACVSFSRATSSGSRAGGVGRGWRRSTKSPGLPEA